MLQKINALLKDISRNPFSGIVKPKVLKHKYIGFWSRRIDSEHRLIYKTEEDEILIAKCKFHYDKMVIVTLQRDKCIGCNYCVEMVSAEFQIS